MQGNGRPWRQKLPVYREDSSEVSAANIFHRLSEPTIPCVLYFLFSVYVAFLVASPPPTVLFNWRRCWCFRRVLSAVDFFLSCSSFWLEVQIAVPVCPHVPKSIQDPGQNAILFTFSSLPWCTIDSGVYEIRVRFLSKSRLWSTKTFFSTPHGGKAKNNLWELSLGLSRIRPCV